MIKVWLVGMLFAGIATVVGFIAFLFGTGFHSQNAPLAYITLTALPFLATAAPTKLLSGHVARASNGAFHAGPMVLGLVAGFVLGAAVGLEFGTAAAFLFAGMIGPIIGAMLGTLVKLAVSPAVAGVISAVLGVIFTYTGSHP